MNPPSGTNITVIGAGIGGLSAALGLQRRGIRVTIYEQAAVLGEVGAGVMLSPNATRILYAWGLGDALARIAYRPRFTAVRDGLSGDCLSKSPLGQDGFHADGSPFLHVHRADLYALLLEAVLGGDPLCLRLGCTLTDVTQSEEAVTATFAHGERLRCAVLVGADGNKSRIRQYIASGARSAFTGNLAWRGLVPASALGPEMLEPESCVFVGRRRHVVRYMLRGGTLVNYVAIAEREAWESEGWSVRSTVREVLSEFDGWHPDVVDLLAATPPDACFKWGLFDHDPLPRWVDRRIALLGDAAHPMLPFMAQGAVMAIEDAAVLAREYKAHDDPLAALHAYQAARLERTSWVQLQSRQNARLYHDGSAGVQFDRDRAMRAERLYDYNAT
jgi:salicylate hydroxylase